MWMGWLVRMSRWVRNPPPLSRVIMVVAIVAVCLGIWSIETYIGWPDWATVHRTGPRLHLPTH